MDKQIHSFAIGAGKRLVLEVSPDNKGEAEFARECEQVAATKPVTIQDFFITLAALQRKKENRQIAENGDESKLKR